MLLPGLDGTGQLLRNFREAIGSHATPILVSYPVDRMLYYAALEAFVRSRRPRRKPFVLLAESSSGPIVLSIAARRPAGFRGLILACSFARNAIPMLGPLAPLIRLLPIRWAPAALLAWPTLVERTRELVAAGRGGDAVLLGVAVAGISIAYARGREVAVDERSSVMMSRADTGLVIHPGPSRHMGFAVPRALLAPLVPGLDDGGGHRFNRPEPRAR